MEQHYIVVFGIQGENIGNSYTSGIIIDEYPGDPITLINLIHATIEKDSYKNFNKWIDRNHVAVKSLTLVYQSKKINKG
jgi:hypothetical protein